MTRSRVGNSAHQFRNRFSVLDDPCWAAVEIFDKDVGRIDAQVVVDGCQKIARAADSFDGIFAAFVRGTNEPSCFDAAARPDV